ncbi:hypothetical protein T484DRAFT_1806694 [Baffinella frigidus]|nr:hypothetical protein T484DRAFT_1806694 [Cryptophyta sp. CCMP2293]
MPRVRETRGVSRSLASTLLLAAALLMAPACSLGASAACLRGWTFTAPSMGGDRGLGPVSSRTGAAMQLRGVLAAEDWRGPPLGPAKIAPAMVARLRGGGENDEEMAGSEEERQEGGVEDSGGGDMGGESEEGLMDFARYGEEINVLAALVAGADPGII